MILGSTLLGSNQSLGRKAGVREDCITSCPDSMSWCPAGILGSMSAWYREGEDNKTGPSLSCVTY